jgi:hypothetical protein
MWYGINLSVFVTGWIFIVNAYSGINPNGFALGVVLVLLDSASIFYEHKNREEKKE